MRHIGQKRPLCLFVLVFVLLLSILRLLVSERTQSRQDADNDLLAAQDRVVAVGSLARKEEKNGKAVFYLEHVQFYLSSGNYSDKYSDKKNSKIIPNHQVNIICYMAETSDCAMLGSRVFIEGKYKPFERAQNEGQFDLRQYYALSGFAGSLSQAQLLSVSGHGNVPAELLYCFKKGSKSFLTAHMKPEDAGIMEAILLGDKGDMDAQQKNLYQKSGIAHILAISGLHISMLGMGLFRLLRKVRLPLPAAVILSVIVVLLYGRMTGAGSSVTRACCMFALMLFAKLTDRTYDLLTGLAFAAAAVLVQNPSDLSGAGFLLSFTAVLGIALLGGAQTQKKECGTCCRLIAGYVMAPLKISISVWLMTLPVMLWFFYTISPYGILLNLVIIPVMSIVLVTGMIAVLLRFSPLLQISAQMLGLVDSLCRASSHLPGWQFVVGRPKVWQIILYYSFLLLLIFLRFVHRERVKENLERYDSENVSRQKRGKWLWGLLLLCNCLFLLLPTRRADAIDMLSVGQGDCVVLRTKEGNCVISDGGSSSEGQVGKYRLIPFLKYQGIRRVDAVFLSHAHDDHYSALIELFEQAGSEGIAIDYLILGSVAKGNDRYLAVRNAALAAGAKVLYMKTGDQARFGSLQLCCIYECGRAPVEDENDESMVLLASYADFSMLFLGDSTQKMEGKVLEGLAQTGSTKVTCLKTAHHGACTSTGEKLLDAICPAVAMVSCGKDNRYGHPHPDTLRRLEQAGTKVFVTKELGQIRARRTGSGWIVENYPFREW